MNRLNTFCQRILNFILICLTVYILGLLSLKIINMLSNIYSVSQLCFSYNEVRDYVGIRLTQFIMNGINPYTIETVENLTVPFLYQYTCLTPVIVAIICKITGLGIIGGNYAANFLFLILTSYNFYLICGKQFYSKIFYKIAVFIAIFLNTCTFFSMFGNVAVTFRPDAAGIYICSLIFLIAYKDIRKTLPLAILSVLLIITKQFMIVFALPVFLYTWVSSNRKTAIRYAVECIIFGVLFFLIVRLVFPLYWTESIYGQFLSAGRYHMELSTAITNIKNCYIRYRWYSIISVAALLIIWLHYIIRKRKGSVSAVNLRSLLEKHSYMIYLLLNIAIATLALTYVARNGGDGYKYCGEMLGPNLFLIILYLITHISQRSQNKTTVNITLALLSCITALTLQNFSMPKYSIENIENYNTVYSLIDEHSDGQMYLGMLANGWMLKNGKIEPDNIWFNDGHIQYFNTDTSQGNTLAKFIFYGKEYVGETAQSYVNEVNEKIRGREFSIVAVAIDSIIDETALEENYYLYGTYNLRTDNNSFDTQIWLPKE